MNRFSNLPNLTKKQRWYAEHLDAASEQNLSISRYAKQHDIALKNIYNAHSRLQKIAEAYNPIIKAPAFIQVGACTAPVSALKTNIRFSNGACVEIPFSSSDLPQLLQWVSRA